VDHDSAFQGVVLRYLWGAIGGASDHITIANVYSDGVIPAGTTPHGFYVSVSPAATDMKFYNVDAHRNYNGFRFDGSGSGVW